MSSSFARTEAVSDVASLAIAHRRPGGPTLVAIDGVTGAGKTIFTAEIVSQLQRSGFSAVKISVDDFHNPRGKRHSMGRHNPEGYYSCSHDIRKLRRLVLDPCYTHGAVHISLRGFDLANDRDIEAATVEVPADSFVICEGSFLLRNELHQYWHFRIFLNSDLDVARHRVVLRDAELFQNIDGGQLVSERYHGAHQIHARRNFPLNAANIVVNNTNPARPLVLAQTSWTRRRLDAGAEKVLLLDLREFENAWIQVKRCHFTSLDRARIAVWQQTEPQQSWKDFEDAVAEADAQALQSGARISFAFRSPANSTRDEIAAIADNFFGVRPDAIEFVSAL